MVAPMQVLDRYQALLGKLDETERGRLQRSMGMKMEQLKARAACPSLAGTKYRPQQLCARPFGDRLGISRQFWLVLMYDTMMRKLGMIDHHVQQTCQDTRHRWAPSRGIIMPLLALFSLQVHMHNWCNHPKQHAGEADCLMLTCAGGVQAAGHIARLNIVREAPSAAARSIREAALC